MPGNLLAAKLTPTNAQKLARVEDLAAKVRKAKGSHEKIASVNQVFTGEETSESAEENGIERIVAKHTAAKRASFFCLVAGFSNEPSDGWDDSEERGRIPNDFNRR